MRFLMHKAAHLLPFAHAQIGARVKAGALLREGVNDGKPECFSQFAQLGQ